MTTPIYLDRAGAAACVSLSESTIERMVREGKFPKPRQLSGARVGWLYRELLEWAEARPVSELPPPPNSAACTRCARKAGQRFAAC